jgi:hypothetical protein
MAGCSDPLASSLGHASDPTRTSDLTARRSSIAAYASAMPAVEVGLEVKHAARVDAAVEHVGEQLRDVEPRRGGTAAPAHASEEDLGERHFHAVRHADDADGGAGGDGERSVD